MQSPTLSREVVQERAQREDGLAAFVHDQRRATVEVPARDDDAMPCIARGTNEGVVVGGPVHQHRDPMAATDRPAVDSGLEEVAGVRSPASDVVVIPFGGQRLVAGRVG